MIEQTNGSDVVKFFEDQGYKMLTISADPDLHLVRCLRPGNYFPRFHCHIPYDPNKGVNLHALDLHYDMRRHRSKSQFAANRSLTSGELVRLRRVLVNTFDVDLRVKEDLLTRFSHLLLFGGAERVNTPWDNRGSQVDRSFARRNKDSKHTKYKREKDWRAELTELDE